MVSNAWDLFESSFQGIVHISLINAKFAKIVTSFLRYLCLFLTWNTLLYSDPSCHS